MSFLGLDVGTSRVKAVRFDDDWQPRDVEAEPTLVLRGSDGRREQDMDDAWSVAARVLSAVARRSPDRIELVAVTGQGDGCWLVDSHGAPAGLAHLWNDGRAADVVDAWRRDGVLDEAFRINGCYGAPGLPHSQLAWAKKHQPDLLDRARTLLSCSGWIYARLTGRQVLDATDAANPFFDATSRTYDPRLMDMYGLTDLARLLPEVAAGPDRVAALTAPDLGMPAGTPVALAPYDVPATAVGAAVIEPGASLGILGTTLCIGTVADTPRLDRHPNGMSLPGTGPDRWLIAYATMIGTEVLDWTATLLGLPDAQAVTALAATAARPDPPVFAPYLSPSGERSPFLDTTVRGTLTGLDSGHTPADVARAAVDGLSLVVRDCLHAAGGATTSPLALSGGGAASDLWCQTISDATRRVVVRPDVAEVGARGALVTAAVDAGLYRSIRDAVSAAARPGATCQPEPARADWFDDAYDRLLAARRDA